MKLWQKIFSILLCVCLAVGMIPTAVSAEGTNNSRAIQLGANAISGYSDTNSYDYIYYGKWDGSPVKWRVLDDQTNTGNKNGLFLLSDTLLGTGTTGGVVFDRSGTSNVWQGSDAQLWCEDFYSNHLTPIEQQSVLSTTKSDAAYSNSSASFGAVANILNDDKIFFLSAAEAEAEAYGFASPDDRTADYNHTPETWWLRSPSVNTDNVTGPTWAGVLFYILGTAINGNVDGENCARPAFNFNTSQVLFLSAAENGKISGDTGADALQEIGSNNGTDWKLTLTDATRNAFSASVDNQNSASASAGGSIPITYSNARTGDNEYVSAMLCDSGSNVLYYGNIAQNSAGGTATVNLPADLTSGSYILKVFSEQCNGNQMTDYASDFQNISLEILPRETTPNASFTTSDDNSGTLTNVDSSMKYSTDGGSTWIDITGETIEITGVTADRDVKLYRPGNGTTTYDSEIQTIDVTQAPQPSVNSIDCTTSRQNDGQITNVDNTMEYRLSTASGWSDITGDTVTGLSDGTYDVRVKANGTVLASAAAAIAIGRHTCAAQGEWQYNETDHWKLCTCGEIVEKTAHTFTGTEDSGHQKCTVCGYAKSSVDTSSSDTADHKFTGPKTGDNSHMVLWSTLMLLAGVILIGTVVYRRKK